MDISRSNQQERNLGDQWVDFYERPIAESRELIILGIGCGDHIRCLESRYPGKALFLVDPRLGNTIPSGSYFNLNTKLFDAAASIEPLRELIYCRDNLTPILCFRPCWSPHEFYFEHALEKIRENNKLQYAPNNIEVAILESLFR